MLLEFCFNFPRLNELTFQKKLDSNECKKRDSYGLRLSICQLLNKVIKIRQILIFSFKKSN